MFVFCVRVNLNYADGRGTCFASGRLIISSTALCFHVCHVCYSKKGGRRESARVRTVPETKQRKTPGAETRGQWSRKSKKELEQSLKKTKRKKDTETEGQKHINQKEALQVVTNCNPHTTMTNSLNNKCSVPHAGVEHGAWPADW